jgi:2,4-dienoyl-CoA reductase-like NADH-dependent reductase (Old Yellow Enzyme family)
MHTNSPGKAVNLSASTPTLFQPLKIRSATFRNRIFVASMCQYSTAPFGPQIGALTDYHIATLGHYALKGAALVMIEASAVQPNGRITPHDSGIWSEEQAKAVKRVADFVHAQGALSGIQLAHAGRKASTVTPWVAMEHGKTSMKADESVGGWPGDVVAPSGGESMAWDAESGKGGFWPPRELSESEVKELVRAHGESAKLAVQAGVDVIEIHAAHGYLLNEFLSPITNRRTDKYGGSFENRIRVVVEIIQAVRQNVPKGMPIFLKVSATEWMEESDIGKELGSWDVESTLRLAKILPDLGVDLLDVSSGGNNEKQRIQPHSNYQVGSAGRIRKTMKEEGLQLLLGAVGLITDAVQAKDIVQESLQEEAEAAKHMVEQHPDKEPTADAIFVARQFMREPEWVLRVAWKLGVDVAWPSQFKGRVRFSE